MKIRQGFVSNSSSSSFVIIGLPLNKELLEKLDIKEDDYVYDKINDLGLEITNMEEDIEYVGKYIFYQTSDDWNGMESTTIKKLLNDENLLKLLKLADKTVDELEIISGNGVC